MSSHYFTQRPRRRGARTLIADVIRGVGFELFSSPEVFSAKEVDEGTRLLLEHAIVPEEGSVLDVGCGYGVIGIVLALLNPRLKVYMVDINPRAVELARLNARHNRVSDRVVVLQGDLYEPVRGMKFRAVYSNPPLAAGKRVLERLVSEAPEVLEPGGILEIVVRKGAEYARRLVSEHFGDARVIVRKKGYTVLLGRLQG